MKRTAWHSSTSQNRRSSYKYKIYIIHTNYIGLHTYTHTPLHTHLHMYVCICIYVILPDDIHEVRALNCQDKILYHQVSFTNRSNKLCCVYWFVNCVSIKLFYVHSRVDESYIWYCIYGYILLWISHIIMLMKVINHSSSRLQIRCFDGTINGRGGVGQKTHEISEVWVGVCIRLYRFLSLALVLLSSQGPEHWARVVYTVSEDIAKLKGRWGVVVAVGRFTVIKQTRHFQGAI